MPYLTYPAPTPRKVHFHPLRLIPMVGPQPFAFDTFFQSSTIKLLMKVPGHGTFPIVIGIAIGSTGHSAMFARSLGLIACAVWLSLDIGVWISSTKWSAQRKACIFCAVSCVAASLAMAIMWWFLFPTLEDQRNETFQKLTINAYLFPGEEDDPMHTMFSATNGGSYNISKKHGIVCEINSIVDVGGGGVSNLPVWSSSGKLQSGGGMSGRISDIPPSNSILVPGDAETDRCLDVMKSVDGTECADVTVIFWYFLENQPDLYQEKQSRLVAYKGKTGKFSWYPEPITSHDNYCEDGLKPPRPAPSP